MRPGRAPRLIRPAANEDVPYTMRFEWGGVPRAVGYALQVFENERLIPPALVDRTVNETFYEAELPVPGPLWWRVRALDGSGRAGTWSAVRRLNIIPPPPAAAVFSISFTPPGLAGGESAEGLVTLVEAAPPGGATVALWAAGPGSGRAFIPPRVLLPAGSTSATFRVDTRPVPGDVEVQVVAGARTGSKSATLTISAARPAARLASFAVNPAQVTAGNSVQGTVALSGPASSAVTVRLATADPKRAGVPAAVVIPAGASAANFVVETAHDNSAGEVAVTASLDGVVKTASLRLRGAAGMTALAAPLPLAPVEGANAVHDAPTGFAWSEVVGASTYTLEIGDSGAFAPPLAVSKVLLGPSASISPLPVGTLFWRVRANDERGAAGEWSQPRALRVSVSSAPESLRPPPAPARARPR